MNNPTLENLAGFALFVQVVDAGSFTAAARELGLSKSAVSKRLAGLEDRLGVRLLNRTTRKWSLTEAGSEVLRHGRTLLETVAAAEADATRTATQPRGTLKVAGPMTFGVHHLAPAVSAFLHAYPEVAIDLTLEDRLSDVVAGGYDVVVRIGELEDSSLIARRLAPVRRVVCGAPSYLERHGTPSRPRDLRRHRCLGYAYHGGGDVWRLGPSGRAVAIQTHGRLRANNGEVLRRAALDGFGLALLPTFIVCEDLAAGRLTPLFWEADVDLALFAVFPVARNLAPKVRVFIDFLATRFGPEPYWDAVDDSDRASSKRLARRPEP